MLIDRNYGVLGKQMKPKLVDKAKSKREIDEEDPASRQVAMF